MHPAEKWQSLVNSAILGSERAGTTVSEDLAQAAKLSTYLRAGHKPNVGPDGAMEPRPSDDTVCGAEAGLHLEEIDRLF